MNTQPLLPSNYEALMHKHLWDMSVKKAWTEQAALDEKSKVYVFKSTIRFPLHGHKYLYHAAKFIFGSPYVSLSGYRRGLLDKVFCFTHTNDTNDLNWDWSGATRHEFRVSRHIDYQKLQEWYKNQKQNGTQVSSFFIDR